MTESSLLIWVLFAVVFLADLLVAAARAAYSNTNQARLLVFREQAPRRVNRALSLIASPLRMKAGFRFAQLTLRFALVGLFFLIISGSIISVWILLGLLLLFGLAVFTLEWLVQARVAKDPESWALLFSAFSRIVQIVTLPFVALPIFLFGDLQSERESGVTETELISMVAAGQQEGVLESDEQKMIVSIFRLGDTLVRAIMVPRIDILALEVDTPLLQAVDAFIRSGHSRLPVYQETVDNILGLLYAKDLLRIWREGNQISSLHELLRQAYFVPEAKKVDELFAELQARRVHMAIVVDEYGGVAGLVTLEDIVEEIVGEIQDEYDQAEESPYQAGEAGDFVFQGRIDLDDFNEIMESDLPKTEADTLGGFVYSQIGHVPVVGDALQVENLLLTVEQVTGRRIRKVRARRIPPVPDNGGNENHDKR